MGIFSVRCQNPECGAKVKKRARVCSQCGTPTPGGWWKCPACSKWVGNDSSFCWSCKTPMHPEEREMMAGGVWQRPGSALAKRFEVGDLYVLLKKGLNVQEGTMAIVLDGGKVKDVLKPGLHNLDSLAHRINHWGSPPPRSAILLDAGEVILPLRVEHLRSAEELDVEFYGEAILRFVPGQAREFVANLMKDGRELSFEELSDRLGGEVRHAIENMCNASTIEDLVKDPERRLRLEDELSSILKRTLRAIGFELVALSGAEFSGIEYEKLRRRQGDLEVKRREAEFDARMREVLQGDQMHVLKDEHDLEIYAAQMAQERDVSTAHCEQELVVLRDRFRRERTAAESDFVRTEATKDTEHRLDLARQNDAYGWEKQRGDAAVKLEIQDDEVNKALDWREKKEKLTRQHDEESRRVEREDEIARAKAYSGMDMTALVAAIGDGTRADRLLELQREKRYEGRSAEEILAIQASESPAVADALRRLHEAQQIRAERDDAGHKALLDEAADRLERVLHEAMKTTAEAAKRSGGDTHIVR